MKFLNVDLELRSGEGLAPLLAAFGESVVVLHSGPHEGKHVAVLELNEEHESPGETILGFCDLIERFSPSQRKAWDALEFAEFDVGSDASPEHCTRVPLGAEVVRRLGSLGASLAVSVYREEG